MCIHVCEYTYIQVCEVKMLLDILVLLLVVVVAMGMSINLRKFKTL